MKNALFASALALKNIDKIYYVTDKGGWHRIVSEQLVLNLFLSKHIISSWNSLCVQPSLKSLDVMHK